MRLIDIINIVGIIVIGILLIMLGLVFYDMYDDRQKGITLCEENGYGYDSYHTKGIYLVFECFKVVDEEFVYKTIIVEAN